MPRDVLPPLPFRPIPMPRPWGGRRAAELLGLDADRFGASGEPIGEWWLVSGRPDHASRVAGGPCDGRSLVELVAADPAAIVGTSASEPARRRFPLLL